MARTAVKGHKRKGRSVTAHTRKVTPHQKRKLKMTFDEWKEGELHSGSKQGPTVKSHKQAIAIALSKAGLSKKVKKHKRKSK